MGPLGLWLYLVPMSGLTEVELYTLSCIYDDSYSRVVCDGVCVCVCDGVCVMVCVCVCDGVCVCVCVI